MSSNVNDNTTNCCSLRVANADHTLSNGDVSWERTHLGDTASFLLGGAIAAASASGTSVGEDPQQLVEWNLGGNKTKEFTSFFEALKLPLLNTAASSSSAHQKESTDHRRCVSLVLKGNPLSHKMSELLADAVSQCGRRSTRAMAEEQEDHDPAAQLAVPTTTTAVAIECLDLTGTFALQASQAWEQTFLSLSKGQADDTDYTTFTKRFDRARQLGKSSVAEEKENEESNKALLQRIVYNHDVLNASTQLRPMLAALGNMYCLQVLSLTHCCLDCASVGALVSGCISRRVLPKNKKKKTATDEDESAKPTPTTRSTTTTEAAFYIAEYRQPRPPLRELHLQFNQIGASGLWDLADAFIGDGTEVLNLQDNHIGRLTATDAHSVKTFGRTSYDPRGLEALGAAVKRGQRTLKYINLARNELGNSAVGNSDQGGVAEVCEMSRWVTQFSEVEDSAMDETVLSGLHLEGNGFSENAVKSLRRASGFRLHTKPQ